MAKSPTASTGFGLWQQRQREHREATNKETKEGDFAATKKWLVAAFAGGSNGTGERTMYFATMLGIYIYIYITYTSLTLKDADLKEEEGRANNGNKDGSRLTLAD